MKSTRLLPSAEIELNAAAEYYDRQRSGVGRSLLDSVEAIVDKIGRFPAMGGKMSGGVRSVLVPGYPFLVIYQDRSDECLIIAVMHTSRRPNYWKKRLE